MSLWNEPPRNSAGTPPPLAAKVEAGALQGSQRQLNGTQLGAARHRFPVRPQRALAFFFFGSGLFCSGIVVANKKAPWAKLFFLICPHVFRISTRCWARVHVAPDPPHRLSFHGKLPRRRNRTTEMNIRFEARRTVFLLATNIALESGLDFLSPPCKRRSWSVGPKGFWSCATPSLRRVGKGWAAAEYAAVFAYLPDRFSACRAIREAMGSSLEGCSTVPGAVVLPSRAPGIWKSQGAGDLPFECSVRPVMCRFSDRCSTNSHLLNLPQRMPHDRTADLWGA